MTAQELILAAMRREGITWVQVSDRLARDEKIDQKSADFLTDLAKDGVLFSTAIAAAIICLLADAKRDRHARTIH